MKTVQEYINQLENGRELYITTVQKIIHYEEKITKHWTVHDVCAHIILIYERFIFQGIKRAVQGKNQRSIPKSFLNLGNMLWTKWYARKIKSEQLIARFLTVHSQVVDYVSTLTEKEFRSKVRLSNGQQMSIGEMVGAHCNHVHHHIEQLKKGAH